MSVYKEFYYVIEEIRSASRHIFEDACDYGVPVKKGDRLWNSIAEIKRRYFSEECGDKRIEYRYSTGSNVQMIIGTLNEYDGSMAEETWSITYTTVRNNKDMDGYLNVVRLSRIKSKSNY